MPNHPRLTEAKVERARSALVALTECVDFGQHFRANTIHGALNALSGYTPSDR